jgi:hypothetical protein
LWARPLHIQKLQRAEEEGVSMIEWPRVVQPRPSILLPCDPVLATPEQALKVIATISVVSSISFR